MEECGCGWKGSSIAKHLNWSPECRPPLPVPSIVSEKSTGLKEKFRNVEFQSKLEAHVTKMHLELLMMTSQIQHAVALTDEAVSGLCTSVLSLLREAAPSVESPVRELFASAQQTIKKLSDVESVCAKRLSHRACHVIERPNLAPANEAKKRFAFLSLASLLGDALQNDPIARSHILATSADWSTGKYYHLPPEEYSDWTSGSRFRNSWLAKKAAPQGQEPLRVRVAIDCWNDDFTATNPIGTKRKEHKYGVVVVRILNLPPHLRDTFNNLLLLGVYSVKWAKKTGGVTRMLCNVHDQTGEEEVGISFKSELEELLQGVPMEIPDDVCGGKKNIILEVGYQGLCCDLLGGAGAGVWPECFQAQHPCLDCWWHSSCFCAYLPEHCRESRRKSAHRPGCREQLVLRTHEETTRDVIRLQQTTFSSKKKRADAFRDSGVARLFSVLQCLPEGNLEIDARKDIMHLFFNGISRHEGYWLIADLVSADCVTWEELDEARGRVATPRGHKIPHLEAPRSEGKAIAQRALVMNAGGVMHFVVNSIALIEPFLDEEARERPSWICWKAHVRLVCFCLRYTYDATTAGDVLDMLIRDYDAKFDVAYPMAFRKPKHHCIKHLRKYLELYGPLRGYWCMGFESFLRILKRMFENCNFKTAPFTVVRNWAYRRAHMLEKGLRDDELSFECSSELLAGAVLHELVSTSQLMRSLISSNSGVSGVRYLSALTRGPLSLEVSDWVLLREGSQALVGKISEMALVSIGVDVVVRLCCQLCCSTPSREDKDGMLRLPKIQDGSKMRYVLVDFERVAVMALSCTERDGILEFRYIY